MFVCEFEAESISLRLRPVSRTSCMLVVQRTGGGCLRVDLDCVREIGGASSATADMKELVECEVPEAEAAS